jgi:hypothetical protein
MSGRLPILDSSQFYLHFQSQPKVTKSQSLVKMLFRISTIFVTVLATSQVQATMSAQDIVNNINQITQLSSDTNKIATGINFFNGFIRVPVRGNGNLFKQILIVLETCCQFWPDHLDC